MVDLQEIADKLNALETEIKKKPSTVPSWLVPAAISASVSLLAALFLNFLLGPKDFLEHIRGIATAKDKIIAACMEKRQEATANLYLIYELKPLYAAFDSVWSVWSKPPSEEYTSFVVAMQHCRLSAAEPPNGKPVDSSETVASAELPASAFNAALGNSSLFAGLFSTVVIPKTDDIREKFYGPERLVFSDELIRRAAQDKNGIAKALVNALVPAEDPKSYRINLYVAFTLARMREGWPASADPSGNIAKLRTPGVGNYRDATFRKRVDEAISNRVESN